MQDNAPVHIARLVQDWLREWTSQNGVELMDWPAMSPDLNPIENVWALLKENIIQLHPDLEDMPKNISMLIYLNRRLWSFGRILARRCCDTLSRRCLTGSMQSSALMVGIRNTDYANR